jgi:hypothetical protein
LCTLPWLGFVPDDVASAPQATVARLAEQLGVDPEVIRSYGRRTKTRTDHLRLVAKYLGWRAAALELKEPDEFLLARAMEHATWTRPTATAVPHLSGACCRRNVLATSCARFAPGLSQKPRWSSFVIQYRSALGIRSAANSPWSMGTSPSCVPWISSVGAAICSRGRPSRACAASLSVPGQR